MEKIHCCWTVRECFCRLDRDTEIHQFSLCSGVRGAPLSLPPSSVSRSTLCVLWLDRAERSSAERDAADGARGRLLFFILSSTTATAKWRRDAFQVLSAGRSACAQTQSCSHALAHECTCTHTSARLGHQRSSHRVILPRRESKDILDSGSKSQQANGEQQGVCTVQENPGKSWKPNLAALDWKELLDSTLAWSLCWFPFAVEFVKWLREGHFFWGLSTASLLHLNIYKVRGCQPCSPKKSPRRGRWSGCSFWL